eukprot:gene14024-16578_t
MNLEFVNDFVFMLWKNCMPSSVLLEKAIDQVLIWKQRRSSLNCNGGTSQLAEKRCIDSSAAPHTLPTASALSILTHTGDEAGVYWFTDIGFSKKDPAYVDLIRTDFLFARPIEGFTDRLDRQDEQEAKYEKFAEKLFALLSGIPCPSCRASLPPCSKQGQKLPTFPANSKGC